MITVIVTAYLRYVHVNETIKSNDGKRLFVYVNLASFCDCVLAALGFTAAGNFLITQSFLLHALGLGSGLFFGSAYVVIQVRMFQLLHRKANVSEMNFQAVLCFFLRPNLGPMWMTLARLVVSGVCFCFCVIALGAGAASYLAIKESKLYLSLHISSLLIFVT